MKGRVDVQEFVKHLKDNGLLIVKKEEYLEATGLRIIKLQKELFKRDNSTLLQVVNAKVLPLTTKNGLKNWIANGKIKNDEHFINKEGKRVISTKGIIRIRKRKGIV